MMPGNAVLRMMRRITIAAMWLFLLAALTTLVSCDPMSHVEYNIHNISGDTVTVTFYKELMTSPYQGFDIKENDSVTTHYGNDSVRVAVLAPNQHLSIHREWHGLYREEQVVHAWKYIKSITIGDTEAPSSTWDNEAVWHFRTEGGGNFAKEESRYYDLWFRENQ